MREHRPATILEHERALIRAALVDVADTVGPFATSSSRTSPTIDAPPIEFPGYELLHEIHRGGQGVVFKAQQIATRRTVALKWLRNGPLATPRERLRFEREVEILTQLRHPHVVAIHDSGTTAGHFYCVMDCVDGRPLVTRAVPNRRAMLDALRLFATICDAVQAAHVAGIAHRDLKPSNILIDAAGEPRVIDFGLAKPLSDLKDSDATQTGQFVGSLQWASPEQVRGDSGVDLRTDVYSLGVVLFQMLTGELPYAGHMGARNIMECVLTAAPLRPRALNSVIDDDVETIILKCLSKERERRYQSAGDLAADVRRYLAGEAIEAKRDSWTYVARKSLKRHWLPASLVSALVVSVAGFAVYAWKTGREWESRQQDTAEALGAILNSLDPSIGPNSTEGVFGALEQVVRTLDNHSGPESETRVNLRFQVATNYRARGNIDAAWRQYCISLDAARRVFGPASKEVFNLLTSAVSCWHDVGCPPGVEQLLAEARVIASQNSGDANRYRAQLRQFEATMCERQGDLASAERLTREEIAIRRAIEPPDRVSLAHKLKSFGDTLCEWERNSDAIPLKREALEIATEVYAPMDEALSHYLHSLSVSLRDADQLQEAEPLARAAVEIRSTHYPPDAWNVYYVWVSQANLGLILAREGVFKEAEDLLVEAHEGLRLHPAPVIRKLVPRVARAITELYDRWDAAEPGGEQAQRAERWRLRQQVLSDSD